MKILALDSSQVQAAVCISVDGKMAGSETGSVAVSHSEALMPLIDRVLKKVGVTLAEIDTFAVGVGPGSFTGIRIGCATIKALAQVLDKPVMPFSSLKALALSAGGNSLSTVAMANAYQGQVFVGWTEGGVWKEDVASAAEWCKQHLRALKASLPQAEPVLFCGTGAKVYWEQIALVGGAELGAHDEQTPYITPDGILRTIPGSLPIPYAQLQANYMRPSQAEIKLDGLVAK